MCVQALLLGACTDFPDVQALGIGRPSEGPRINAANREHKLRNATGFVETHKIRFVRATGALQRSISIYRPSLGT